MFKIDKSQQATKVFAKARLDIAIFSYSSLSPVVPADGLLFGFSSELQFLKRHWAAVPGWTLLISRLQQYSNVGRQHKQTSV